MFEAVMQQHGDGLKGLGFFTHTGHRVGVMMNFRQLVNKKKEVNIHDDFLGMFGLLVVLWNCFFFFLGGACSSVAGYSCFFLYPRVSSLYYGSMR